MRALRLALVVAAVAAVAAPAAAQWTPPGDSPADLAARARLERERLRALADERQAAARADQLRAEATLYGLDRARAPAFVPPPGPVVEAAPLSGLAEREDALSADAARRRQDTERRLAAMDAWLAGW